MQLELEETDEKSLSENPGFIKRLENLSANRDAPPRKMREIRTAENDLVEAVKNAAVNLTNLAGFGAVGASVRFSGDAGVYEIAVEYASESSARFLLETAVEAVAAALENQPFEVSAKIAEARAIGETDKQNDLPFSPGKKPKIPIVAITGTNGKTTVTRLTAHVLLQTGLNIGTTTTDGILLNGEIIERGDTTGPASARKILENAAVDIAVLETARGGIMRRGLGWNWADIAVVTNITEDHIGQDGIESVADLVNVKSLIAERVRENGTLILNADDPESAALATRPAVTEIQKKIVYFAMSEANPILRQQSEAGEIVYFVRDNWICERRGAAITPIAETTKIPIAMNGTADFQIQNAMAVAAVSRALYLSPEKIAAALHAFQSDVHNQGRSNFYRVGKGFALIDYGHNPKALEAICRMTSRWTDKTITGIISFPGDRRDDVIKAAGRIAVAGFDRIIVKGDVNLRGRKSGEVAEMLCRIVLEAGNQNECKIVLDATKAFEEAIAEINENEVVVFFYEKLAPVLATLEKYGAVAATTF
ncbi:MAG TPA: Mur ligase family protein [Pyrinomonadaceae bacterium]|nr:Mur ligase family protein [Pyrinomonadaceae bacterium]